MTALYLSSLLLIALLACGAVWCIHRAYIHTIDGLRADNKDLRDRLFQKNALPPSGVDLTEKYEERQEREREHRLGDRPMRPKGGPLKEWNRKMEEKDKVLVERKNIDATRGRFN